MCCNSLGEGDAAVASCKVVSLALKGSKELFGGAKQKVAIF